MGSTPPLDTTKIHYYGKPQTKPFEVFSDNCFAQNLGSLAGIAVYWNDSLIGYTDTINGYRGFTTTISFDSLPFKYKVKLVKPGFITKEKVCFW